MTYEKDLDTKTFIAITKPSEAPVELDKQLEEFKVDNDIHFTQTGMLNIDGNILHKAVAFYKPRHKAYIDIVEDVKEEKKEIWTSCTICNKRWKYSHYAKCPNGHGIEGIPDKEKEIYEKIYGG